jgi:methylmalonyl-CoA epimerase
MTSPIGRLDHIGIAVKNLAEARRFFEDILGAKLMYSAESVEAGYKLCELELGGVTFELLEPLGPNGEFLRKFMARRGEGMHHVTFNAPNSKEKAAELKAKGVRVVGETEWSPTSYEAFISPTSAHGVLIQIGSGYPTLANDPAWQAKK